MKSPPRLRGRAGAELSALDKQEPVARESARGGRSLKGIRVARYSSTPWGRMGSPDMRHGAPHVCGVKPPSTPYGGVGGAFG